MMYYFSCLLCFHCRCGRRGLAAQLGSLISVLCTLVTSYVILNESLKRIFNYQHVKINIGLNLSNDIYETCIRKFKSLKKYQPSLSLWGKSNKKCFSIILFREDMLLWSPIRVLIPSLISVDTGPSLAIHNYKYSSGIS